MIRLLFHLAIVAVAFLAAACIVPITSPSAANAKHYLLHEFTKHKVHVVIELEEVAEGSFLLLAKFIPTNPTLHLYSKDLPVKGIDGIGRPTTFSILSGPMIANGALSANVAEHEERFHQIDGVFPLYPDGAVTLTLPVKYDAMSSDERLTVAITYMACSSEGYCFPPVVDYSISLEVPNELR